MKVNELIVQNVDGRGATGLVVVNLDPGSSQMGGQTMTNDSEMMKISIAILEERVAELEHIVKRLHNTVHFQKKHSGEDGFGYWQVG